jgi:prenylcysteine alpha-carboxyl methylesterase
VEYPGGANDIQLAREWIFNHISAEKYGQGSVNKVFLFGHSSGGAHVAMNLYAAGKSTPPNLVDIIVLTVFIGDPQRVPTEAIFPPVAGVLYLDVPFWYDVRKPMRQKIITSYYGSHAEEVWEVSSNR